MIIIYKINSINNEEIEKKQKIVPKNKDVVSKKESEENLIDFKKNERH